MEPWGEDAVELFSDLEEGVDVAGFPTRRPGGLDQGVPQVGSVYAVLEPATGLWRFPELLEGGLDGACIRGPGLAPPHSRGLLGAVRGTEDLCRAAVVAERCKGSDPGLEVARGADVGDAVTRGDDVDAGTGGSTLSGALWRYSVGEAG